MLSFLTSEILMGSKYGLHLCARFLITTCKWPLRCNWGNNRLVKLFLLFSQCYMQIFGPGQGSSCSSVCRDPRQHNRIPGVVWQVRYKVVWGHPPQHGNTKLLNSITTNVTQIRTSVLSRAYGTHLLSKKGEVVEDWEGCTGGCWTSGEQCIGKSETCL